MMAKPRNTMEKETTISAEEDDHIGRGCPGYENWFKQNWNGNVVFGNARTYLPRTLEEIQSIVTNDKNPTPIRVIGRGHSFSDLAKCSNGTLISLRHMNQILDFQPPIVTPPKKRGSLTIEGGTTYTEIAQFLEGKRGALRNLPSCPQFTVAGAIATATHGSGIHHQNLAADVSMIEFVCSDGSLKRYSRDCDEDILNGCRIHLGCFGIVSKLTLDIYPYFEVHSVRYDDVPLTLVIPELPNLWQTCDSLSLWTSGFGVGDGSGECWLCFRHFIVPDEKDKEKEEFESVHVPLDKSILGDAGHTCHRKLPRYCTDPANPELFDHTTTQSQPWATTLTLTLDKNNTETSMTTVDIQAEFFIPLQYAVPAMHAVWECSKLWTFSSPWGYNKRPQTTKGLVDAMEFRQVKGNDGGWLSPHDVDSLGIHISFNGDPSLRPRIIDECVPKLEVALKPYGPVKAHWGKLGANSFQPKYIERVYGSKLTQFQNLCQQHDPKGKFRNEHTNCMLFSTASKSKL